MIDVARYPRGFLSQEPRQIDYHFQVSEELKFQGIDKTLVEEAYICDPTLSKSINRRRSFSKWNHIFTYFQKWVLLHPESFTRYLLRSIDSYEYVISAGSTRTPYLVF